MVYCFNLVLGVTVYNTRGGDGDGRCRCARHRQGWNLMGTLCDEAAAAASGEREGVIIADVVPKWDV